jgi:hypothetical protein
MSAEDAGSEGVAVELVMAIIESPKKGLAIKLSGRCTSCDLVCIVGSGYKHVREYRQAQLSDFAS